jgi:hypothetical protein
MKKESNLILGKNLRSNFKNNILKSDYLKNLSDSPNEALHKIYLKHGSIPSESGHNLPIIKDLRDKLFDYDPEKKFCFAFMLTAPHTHWDKANPIIIEKLGNYYFIGNKSPEVNKKFIPVSFFIDNQDIFAYEWASESCEINLDEANECINFLKDFVKTNKLENEGFGISLNFRFKGLYEKKLFANIENPFNGKISGYEEVSIIEIISNNSKKKDLDKSSEQVSWHFISDLNHNLNKQEIEILNIFRNLE